LAGIYIHIPFCKQACFYCNFHFSTSLKRKNELVAALLSEIELRKDYLGGDSIETIYFGGGTPSLLSISDIEAQIGKIFSSFKVDPDVEITIEANPDDIDEEKLKEWKKAGINRLSMGIQSFFEEDLKWMNRAHNARQAIQSLELTLKYFDNLCVDLIYGIPALTNENWKINVDKVISLHVPHLSCYALTIEPKTALHKMIKNHQVDDVNPDKQSEQFLLLMEWMEHGGYEHYEISNFAKPGYRSRHNSSYWNGKRYIGVGPSSHSFDGTSRQWNVSNNNIYIDSIKKSTIPCEKEILTPIQQLNEYVMTSLRTMEGLDLTYISEEALSRELRASSQKFIDRRLMVNERNHLKLTKQGKLLADGIAAELFFDR